MEISEPWDLGGTKLVGNVADDEVASAVFADDHLMLKAEESDNRGFSPPEVDTIRIKALFVEYPLNLLTQGETVNVHGVLNFTESERSAFRFTGTARPSRR